jgi:hypothetical protein
LIVAEVAAAAHSPQADGYGGLHSVGTNMVHKSTTGD